MPSIIDPNPLSAIEALASGLPILLSKHCGNVKECIIHNQNGWSFNPLDEDEIQNSIELWSRKTIDELNEMGDISRQRYKKYFSLKKTCENLTKEIVKISPKNIYNI